MSDKPKLLEFDCWAAMERAVTSRGPGRAAVLSLTPETFALMVADARQYRFMEIPWGVYQDACRTGTLSVYLLDGTRLELVRGTP